MCIGCASARTNYRDGSARFCRARPLVSYIAVSDRPGRGAECVVLQATGSEHRLRRRCLRTSSRVPARTKNQIHDLKRESSIGPKLRRERVQFSRRCRNEEVARAVELADAIPARAGHAESARHDDSPVLARWITKRTIVGHAGGSD